MYANESKSIRVQVYALSQQFWDTQTGDTLSGISQQLLPNNPSLRYSLEQEIIKNNPGAFINNNPDLLKANVRIWLPNAMNQSDTKVDPEKYQVESFSWGNIKRPIRE